MGGYRRSQRKKARSRETRYVGADGVWRTWREVDELALELLLRWEIEDRDEDDRWEDTWCSCDDEECTGGPLYCDGEVPVLGSVFPR